MRPVRLNGFLSRFAQICDEQGVLFRISSVLQPAAGVTPAQSIPAGYEMKTGFLQTCINQKYTGDGTGYGGKTAV